MTLKDIRGQKIDKMLLKFYITSMLSNAMFYLPTLVYFFSAKIADPLYVSVLISLKSITTFIFEVPTGFIADKYGRKTSMLIGMLINMLSLVFLIVGNDFIYFAIAQCLFGLAETFRSGSDMALLYDNLKYKNETEKFEKFTQNNFMYVSSMVVLSYIIGGYIYEVNDKLPFMATLILLVLASVVFLTLEEHPYKNKDEKHLSIKESINFLKGQASELWSIVIFGNIIIGICISTYVYYAPILLSSYGVSGKYFGYIFSFGIMAGAICAKLTDRFTKKEVFISRIAPIAIAIMCRVSYIFNTKMSAILFVIVLRLIWGMYSIMYMILVNNHVSQSSIRATLISIGNGVVGISSVINTMLFGLILRYFDTRVNMLFLVMMMLLIMTVFNVFIIKSNKIEEATSA